MFFDGIESISGVGQTRRTALARLGIFTISDMLYHFPRRFENRAEFKKIFEFCDGDSSTVTVCAHGEMRVSYIRSGMTVYRQTFIDDTGALEGVWFNNPYVKTAFHEGVQYNLYGKVSAKYRKKEMTTPLFERTDSTHYTGRIIPVYNLTAGLSQKLFMQIEEKCLAASVGCIPETIPDFIRRNYHLAAVDFSMKNIHFPKDFESFETARRRFVFEEFFELRTGLALARQNKKVHPTSPMKKISEQEFFDLLPFSPTNAQRSAVTEVFSDLAKSIPMNRLVQGDVGSGKTVVACAALYAAAKSGFQGALMAPTEILATQHLQSLKELFPKLNIALLSGKLTALQKRTVLADIESGKAQIIIGTHALLEDRTVFRRLGVIVTDEQHRFGVRQRGALCSKGKNPHVLVMSATPIPRTLSHVLYGDLDVSIIDELPPGRQKVDTFAVSEDKRDRAYGFVRRELERGNCAYIVCPLVEEGELQNVQNVVAHAKKIQKKYFEGFTVGLVHGKMKSAEKDAVMADFSAGKIQVLVATTVIEVGVNVPKATIMVIENAERFGLSQLHQLRGRVGRGTDKSYCIMFSDNDSDITKKRLRIMTSTNDGFKISEEDMKLRGPGDFFGTRQHGLPELKIANIFTDTELLKEAGKATDELLHIDPSLHLEAHIPLRKRISVMFSDTIHD